MRYVLVWFDNMEYSNSFFPIYFQILLPGLNYKFNLFWIYYIILNYYN